MQENSNIPVCTPEQAAAHFRLEGKFLDAVRYGSGHINDTYLVRTETDRGVRLYILQRVNGYVFKEPWKVMENIAGVTGYLREFLLANGGDPDRECLTLVKTTDGGDYFISEDGKYWRVFLFIVDSVSYDKVESPEQFYTCGVAFGNFQYLLRGYPAEKLHETIPNFHNTPDRFRQLTEAIAENKAGRLAEVGAEIAFCREREEFAGLFERARAEGKLPLRVTHNDTKLNNILFDKASGAPVCVIDLDTIMPGYAINDFGDSIRFGATTAAEDEADLSKVHFDLSLFEIYAKGFIEGAKGGLTEGEISRMPEAAIMMTFECGMRFLADYLNGDVYFRTSRERHNLDRARNQFKLVRDMEESLPAMHAVIEKYAK